jgi:outer membrane protein
MKKLLTSSLTWLFSCLGSFGVFAQQPAKLGHIDTNELLRMMPGRDSAQVQLERYARELEEQFVPPCKREFQTKYQDYLEKQALFQN